jgi:hypothetical protein
MTAALQRLAQWIKARPLAVFLPLQSALLLYNLSLLPVWGDEQFTLNVIARPWTEIPAVVRADIHPPLYYLLTKAWTELLPLGPAIERARAFSVVWCLLSTVLIYRLWVRRWAGAGPFWFLVLWTFSPALMLYARMARSYTLQIFCGCLLLYAALRFLERPAGKRWLFLFSLAAALTLYVHYLPGVALVAATALEYGWRRRHEPAVYRWRPLITGLALTAVLYLPWVWTLAASLQRVAVTDAYMLTGSYALEHVVRSVYWFASFTFGESLPTWMIVACLAVTPLILWLCWVYGRSSGTWFESSFGRLPAFATAITYLGTAMWVAFAFTPARSLFLLPFYLMWLAGACLQQTRTAPFARAALLVIWAVALGSYLRKDGFLNKGYLTPFDQIASTVRDHSAPDSTLVVVGAYNVDPKPVIAQLCGDYRCIVVAGPEGEQAAREAAENPGAEVVWYLRGSHDVSPGAVHQALEAEFARNYEAQRHLYLPYTSMERAVLRLVGWTDPPTHFYQALEFRRANR